MSTRDLEIRLLGSFDVEVEGRTAANPKSKKAQLLLAFLALRPNRQVSRSYLATMLWPDSDPTTARFNLRQMLVSIRKECPDVSACIGSPDRDHLQFGGGCLVDAIEFLSLADSQPREAVRIYRGPLLDGAEGEWIEAKRAELAETYLSTLETLAEQSDAREAARVLRLAVDADPFRESLLQKLMVSLAEAGDLAGAQIAYRRFQELLHRELHAEPSPETERLLRRLHDESRSRPLPEQIRRPTSFLPTPGSSIVGREAAINSISGLLAASRLVTLTGAGGSGKTRLCIAVGERCLAEGCSSVWFVDFTPVTDGSLVPSTIAQTLGIRDQGTDHLSIIARTLGESPCLLIFDNCEHVLEAGCNAATELLRRCVEVRILASSRQPLGVLGEQRFQVSPLELPTSETPQGEIGRCSALRLFESCARLVKPDFSVDTQNAEQVAKVCRSVDALPLGIEMAAAKVGSLPVPQIARMLEERVDFLKSGSQRTGRHSTMETVIDWSCDLLTEAERVLFKRLAVFVGGWTLEEAEQICSGGGVEAHDILDLLSALLEKCLIVADLGGEAVRYRLLETVRQYASGRLQATGEWGSLRDRHLASYLQLAEHAEPLLRGREQQRWMHRLESEHDNFRAALRWCVEAPERSEGALRLSAALGLFWFVRSYWEEGQRYLAESLERAPKAPPSLRAKALLKGCWLGMEPLTGLAEQSLALSRGCGDEHGIANASILLAIANRDMGRFDRAEEFGAEALEIYRRLCDEAGTAHALVHLGVAACYRGEYDRSKALLQDSLRINRSRGDKKQVAFVLSEMLYLAHLQRDSSAAKALSAEALRLSAELGDKNLLASLHESLGGLALYAGDTSDARAHHSASLEIFRALGHRHQMPNALDALAFVSFAEGDTLRSVRLWAAASALRDDFGLAVRVSDREMYDAHLNRARIAMGERAFGDAWEEGRAYPWGHAAEYALSP